MMDEIEPCGLAGKTTTPQAGAELLALADEADSWSKEGGDMPGSLRQFLVGAAKTIRLATPAQDREAIANILWTIFCPGIVAGAYDRERYRKFADELIIALNVGGRAAAEPVEKRTLTEDDARLLNTALIKSSTLAYDLAPLPQSGDVRGALEFYADRRNWVVANSRDTSVHLSNADRDCGEVARRALSLPAQKAGVTRGALISLRRRLEELLDEKDIDDDGFLGEIDKLLAATPDTAPDGVRK